MKKTELQIGFSPLTNKIYMGRAEPGANHWAGEKQDVTNVAIHCVALHVLHQWEGDLLLTVGDSPDEELATFHIQVSREK